MYSIIKMMTPIEGIELVDISDYYKHDINNKDNLHIDVLNIKKRLIHHIEAHKDNIPELCYRHDTIKFIMTMMTIIRDILTHLYIIVSVTYFIYGYTYTLTNHIVLIISFFAVILMIYYMFMYMYNILGGNYCCYIGIYVENIKLDNLAFSGKIYMKSTCCATNIIGRVYCDGKSYILD